LIKEVLRAIYWHLLSLESISQGLLATE